MRRPRPSARLAAAALAGACATVAACGGEAAAPVNPARAVPPEAAVYIGVVLQPRGDAALAAGPLTRRLFGRLPARSLARAAGPAFVPGGRPLRFARDVRPWLGPRAAIFYLPRPGGPPDRGLVAIAAHRGAAYAAVARIAGGLPERSVRGRRYRSDGRRALAADGGFVIAGDERAVRAALRALASGLSLGASDRFARAVPPGGPRRLAVIYADPPRAAPLLAGLGLGAAAGLQASLAAAGAAPVVAAVSARPGGLAIDAGARPASAARTDGSPPAPPLPAPRLAGLPASAQAAAASPGPLGTALAAALDPQTLPGLRAPALEAAVRRLRRGVDPAGAARTLGPAAIAAGAGGAALLAESPRPAALARDLRAAGRALGVSPLAVAVAGRRVAAGTSAGAVRAVLHPGRRLETLPAYRQARQALGARLVPFGFVAGRALRAGGARRAAPLLRRALRAVAGAAVGAGAGVLRLALAIRPGDPGTRPASP